MTDIRPLGTQDLEWAAALFDRGRNDRAHHSPVFWNPAPDAMEKHKPFLAELLDRDTTVALRGDRAVVVAPWFGAHFEVDDFAVEADDVWAGEGLALLRGVLERGPVRLVAPRCMPERHALADAAGLRLSATWWVQELEPEVPADPAGPVLVDGCEALLVQAPPVYAPGGAVLLIPAANDEWPLAALVGEGRRRGAVVAAVIQRAEGPSNDVLAAAGFHALTDFMVSPSLLEGVGA